MVRFMRFKDGKAKALTFSYDDGVQSDARFIKILDKYGMKATFNINAGMFAPEGTVYPEGEVSCRMTKREAYDLYNNSGHEVGIHGYYHYFMEQLPPSQMVDEILSDRKVLEEMFEKRIDGGAYPFGTYSDELVDALRICGVKYCRTTISTEKFALPTDWLRLNTTCHHSNPRLMSLAEQFLASPINKQPRLFYLWGHTYEFNRDNNWGLIEEFAEKMADNENIWYATNMEIYEYIQAYNRLEYYADGNTIYNPTLIDVWMYQAGKVYKIASGETVKIGK